MQSAFPDVNERRPVIAVSSPFNSCAAELWNKVGYEAARENPAPLSSVL